VIQTISGCASTPPDRLRVVTSPQGVVTRLADLTVSNGTACMVSLVAGGHVNGKVVSMTPTELVLDVGGGTRKVVAEADIARVARLRGGSKSKRAKIGAAAGAVASLPLSMSMVGDAMLVGALVGAMLGRNTGDARLEVVLQR
jgi:hypothetical protein